MQRREPRVLMLAASGIRTALRLVPYACSPPPSLHFRVAGAWRCPKARDADRSASAHRGSGRRLHNVLVEVVHHLCGSRNVPRKRLVALRRHSKHAIEWWICRGLLGCACWWIVTLTTHRMCLRSICRDSVRERKLASNRPHLSLAGQQRLGKLASDRPHQ